MPNTNKAITLTEMIQAQELKQAMINVEYKRKHGLSCPNCGFGRLLCLVHSFITGNTYKCRRCSIEFSKL